MHGRVFVQRPVRPNAIIVACIGAQHAPQVPLANDNDVVQAFPANGPNQSFGIAVLPCLAAANSVNEQALPR